MKGFLDYVTPKSRKYVSLEMEEKSRTKLQDWANSLGFDTETSFSGKPQEFMDYHITVFYSENESSLENSFTDIPEFVVTASHFELLGENKDIPVLIIAKNEELEKYYDEFEAKGLQSKWPDWKIHISLSYKYDGKPDIKSLPLPPFPLVFDKLKVENIKD